MVQIEEEKIVELMFDIWYNSKDLKNPIMVGEYIANKLREVITVTHCCKSDSEQLVLFADWLQYNGKWSTTEQQVKDFLKEQQEQN